MNPRRGVLIGTVVIIAGIGFGGMSLLRQCKIDACLDSGGRVDNSDRCEH
jgi:hypothetical protein